MQTVTQEDNKIHYGFNVGDSVFHIKDMVSSGIVIEIDSDYDLGDVTTCRVVWGAKDFEDAINTPREDQDIQWTNKLIPMK